MILHCNGLPRKNLSQSWYHTTLSVWLTVSWAQLTIATHQACDCVRLSGAPGYIGDEVFCSDHTSKINNRDYYKGHYEKLDLFYRGDDWMVGEKGHNPLENDTPYLMKIRHDALAPSQISGTWTGENEAETFHQIVVQCKSSGSTRSRFKSWHIAMMSLGGSLVVVMGVVMCSIGRQGDDSAVVRPPPSYDIVSNKLNRGSGCSSDTSPETPSHAACSSDYNPSYTVFSGKPSRDSYSVPDAQCKPTRPSAPVPPPKPLKRDHQATSPS